MPYRIDQQATRTRIRRVIGEKAGGKQQALAEMADIQSSMLSKLLSGVEAISRRHLLKIEKATQARLTWLEYGIEPVYYQSEKEVPERADDEIFEGVQLKNYLDKKGITYADFARRLGKSKNTLAGYFKTETLSNANRKAILDELGVSEDEIFSFGNPQIAMTSIQSKSQLTRFPQVTEETQRVIRIPVGARAGFNFDEYFSDVRNEEQGVELPSSWLKRGKTHAIVEVNGDSMQNTLQSGHEVLAYLVDPNDWPYVEKIVVVEFRDHFIIKRVDDNDLLHDDGILTLSSDNPASGATFRVPKSEIRHIWQVIRNMGGPL